MRRFFVLFSSFLCLALLSQQASAQTYFVGSDYTQANLTPFDANRHYLGKTISVPRPPGNGTWQLRVVAAGWYTGGNRPAYLYTSMRQSTGTTVDGPFIQLVQHQVSTSSQTWTDTRNFIYGATTNTTMYVDVHCSVQGQTVGASNPTAVWNGTLEVYWDYVGP